ncbi:TPA: HNH endonuclease [Aeromonas dhakensis]|jgi:hypothetical protein|uniref:HNH endonuclease signature motif containing protein n=1 Tax=Aeromonas TaxID=642 RepID=UPI002890DA97|nr:HNH endonuclease [Aeromonas dhakensis]HDX8487751.1 HNH endonuclease [Aeromonas dhakensis]HDX8514657.1 HNH endonuclease [Aeromonas dhakensis]HDZ8906985.1 HNH endonuclease [Aeromonas dhakensis]HDZ9334607.1 HNH endonuclease [Aeromonas dhakensis]
MSNWSEKTISEVWNKATFISQGNELKGFRQDQCGAWIQRSQYGNRDSKYGWEIDHVTPVSKNGGDNLGNLRPLHWKNNAARQDNRLSCTVYSEGIENVGL